jgi:diaminopimelate decarboxylase
MLPRQHTIFITTGTLKNKFGIDLASTTKNYSKNRKEYKNIKIIGLHIHIGSQIINASNRLLLRSRKSSNS